MHVHVSFTCLHDHAHDLVCLPLVRFCAQNHTLEWLLVQQQPSQLANGLIDPAARGLLFCLPLLAEVLLVLPTRSVGAATASMRLCHHASALGVRLDCGFASLQPLLRWSAHCPCGTLYCQALACVELAFLYLVALFVVVLAGM